VPQGTETSTTWLAQTESAYTSTVTASGYQNGTVIYGSPSATTQTTTVTRGGMSYTTTLAPGNQATPGTVEVSYHAQREVGRAVLMFYLGC